MKLSRSVSLVLVIFLSIGVFLVNTGDVQAQIDDRTATKLNVPVGLYTHVIKSDEASQIVIKDYAGSTRGVDDNSGSVVFQNYYSYGEELETNISTTDNKYAGHRVLEGVGVSHVGVRFYSSRLSRFIQADRVAGPDRYVYAGNNPISFVDVSGEDKDDVRVFNEGRLSNPQAIRASGTVDPVVMDQAIPENLVYASVAFVGVVAAPVVASYAPVATSACLGNPVACTGIATETFAASIELTTGADLPAVGVGDVPVGKLSRKLDEAVGPISKLERFEDNFKASTYLTDKSLNTLDLGDSSHNICRVHDCVNMNGTGQLTTHAPTLYGVDYGTLVTDPLSSDSQLQRSITGTSLLSGSAEYQNLQIELSGRRNYGLPVQHKETIFGKNAQQVSIENSIVKRGRFIDSQRERMVF